MSREKKVALTDGPSVLSSPPSDTATVTQPLPATPMTGPERLSDVDRLTLELSKSKRQIAVAEAKTAIANNENAELSYKYLVLQIYMKYGLTTEDTINSDTGEIVRGAARGQ